MRSSSAKRRLDLRVLLSHFYDTCVLLYFNPTRRPLPFRFSPKHSLALSRNKRFLVRRSRGGRWGQGRGDRLGDGEEGQPARAAGGRGGRLVGEQQEQQP